MKKNFFISTILLASLLLVACSCDDCGKNQVEKECYNEEQCCETICFDEQHDSVLPEGSQEDVETTKGSETALHGDSGLNEGDNK